MPRDLFRRLRLFIRDYINEFGVAWSVARYRDCERSGGHRWGPVQDDELFDLMRVCSRCGCSESVPRVTTVGTAASDVRYRFVFDHVSGKVRREPFL